MSRSGWLNTNSQFHNDIPMKWVHGYCEVVSFENICENRRGLFRDHEHTELACRYTRDRCIVLGLSDCESKLYTPHSAFETVGFEEPIYWLITHSDQINKLIDKLDELVWGSITEADFLAMFPPANPEKIGDPTIDYEGFVFMETRPMQSTGTNGVVYMYRKIKAGHGGTVASIVIQPYSTHK